MAKNYLNHVKDNSKYFAIAVFLLGALVVGGITTTMSSMGLQSQSNTQAMTASGGADAAYDAAPRTESELPPRTPSGGEPDAEQKKIITSYNIDFKVKDVESALQSTNQLSTDYGGWIDSQRYNTGRTDSGYITVRVPTENVSEFLQEIESNWELKSKDQNKQDVTSRYTELSLELENKRQELQRLEEMMNSTEEVDNLIKVQERMSEIRSRLQYLENQLEGIDRRVDYTEIRISFEQPETFTAEFKLRETFSNAYQGIFKSLKLIIVGTGYLLPFALILTVVHYGRRALRGRD